MFRPHDLLSDRDEEERALQKIGMQQLQSTHIAVTYHKRRTKGNYIEYGGDCGI
jgi:hypothetical protein